MLHIIGLLLKILGIILAVLLGIIVLLMCIVLFAPVRYEVSAEFPGKLEDMVAKIRFSWFLYLIAGEAGYAEKDFYWKGRAAWFRFGGEEKESVENVVAQTKEEIKETADTVVEKAEKIVEEAPAQKEEVKKEETVKKEKIAVEKKTEATSGQERISFFQKLKNKLKDIWEKIKYTFLEICDKMKNIAEIKENITSFLTDETHKKAFLKVKKESKKLIWSLRPKKFKLNLHYGFEDPYRTGQVLAGLSMIYPFVGDNMSIQPDFEHQIIEGNLYMKGKIRAIHPVIFLIKLVLNKNIRQTFIDGKNFKLK